MTVTGCLGQAVGKVSSGVATVSGTFRPASCQTVGRISKHGRCSCTTLTTTVFTKTTSLLRGCSRCVCVSCVATTSSFL